MRPSLRTLAGVAVVAGLVAAPGASAVRSHDHHEHGSPSAHVAPPISAAELLPAAAASNQFEIVTGNLAQERAASDEVKALGAMFVEHHTALLAKGRAVAAELGLTVPETLTPKQQRIVAKLQRLSGERFDRKWLKAQIAAHEEALALHLRGAIRGVEPQIRTLAQGGLPFITAHYGELLDLAGVDDDDHGYGDDDDHGDGHHHGGGHRHRHGG